MQSKALMRNFNYLKIVWAKKIVVLFPEIVLVKIFFSIFRPHSQMCVRIYNFCLTPTHDQKPKETKEEKKISVKNLMGYDIDCEFAVRTYVIELRFSTGCS